MKKYTILFFLFVFCFLSHAQIYQFQKIYGAGNAYRSADVKVTPDGGYIIAGSGYDTVNGVYRAIIIKTDAAGTLQWSKNYSDGGEDWIYSIDQTNDGGYIFAGSTSVNPFYPAIEIYIIKTDSLGNLQWTKTIFDSGSSFAAAIKQTSDGNYIMTGCASDSLTGSKVMITKIDNSGNVLWANKYGGPIQSKEYGLDILEANNGNYVAVGMTGTYGAGSNDIYLVETDPLGNLLWTKTYGGVLDETGYSISKVNNENGFFIAGSAQSFSPSQNDEVYLLKTDALGNLLWSKTYTEGGQYGGGYSMINNAQNTIFIYGTQLSLANGHEKSLLLKTDATGNLIWSKEFNYTSYSDAAKVIQTTFNGLALVASCGSQFYNGQILLIKTDSLGNSGCSQIVPVITTAVPPTQGNSGGARIPYGQETDPSTLVLAEPLQEFTLCLVAGITETENEKESVVVFPVPSNGIFRIQSEEPISEITAFDIFGKQIYESSLSGKSIAVDLSLQPDGIYFLKIKTAGGIVIRKIIKE